MGKIIKDALILFAITLVAGILLGGVFEVTKKPIEEQSLKAKQAAYKAVLSEAESFEQLEGDAYKAENIAAAFAGKLEENGYSKDSINEIVAGVKGGEVVGLVVTVTAGDGYGGNIQYSVGVDSQGKYLGTSILSINETAGLGMRVKTDPTFLNQFVGAATDSFVLTNTGAFAADEDANIDAISGSTVTSKAILRGVNAALIAYKQVYDSNLKTVGGVVIE